MMMKSDCWVNGAEKAGWARTHFALIQRWYTGPISPTHHRITEVHYNFGRCRLQRVVFWPTGSTDQRVLAERCSFWIKLFTQCFNWLHFKSSKGKKTSWKQKLLEAKWLAERPLESLAFTIFSNSCYDWLAICLQIFRFDTHSPSLNSIWN